MDNYDLVIIGGGAGAFAAAIKANQLGAKTLMVNKGLPLGGTCVNVGCVPSKYLLSVGELAFRAQHPNFSAIAIPDVHVDFERAIEDEQKLVLAMRQVKYKEVLRGLKNVTFLSGEARFSAATEIEVGNQKFQGKKIIIATGSTAIAPSVDGLQKTGYLTHVEALNMRTLPERLLVIGSGPLGLEFSQMYHNFGSKVDMLVRGSQVFPRTEPELSQALENAFNREGITIWKQAQAVKVARGQEDKVVSVTVDGKAMELKVDEILVAMGKRPNTGNLNLQAAGVQTNPDGAVTVGDNFETSATNIFAVGDVIDRPLRLEMTAGKEGSYAAENALTGTKRVLDYNSVPYTVFTNPQLAGVGLTEEQEMEQFGRCLCRTVSFADLPKAVIIGHTEGLIKMVIHPESKVILGVHLVSPSAGDLIAIAVMFIRNKNTINDVIESLPMFPTLSEAFKLVATSFREDISQLSCCI